MSETPIINHEEATLLADVKCGESNLARCYLDLKSQLSTMRERTIEDCAKAAEARAEWLRGKWGTDAAPERAELEMLANSIRALSSGGKE